MTIGTPLSSPRSAQGGGCLVVFGLAFGLFGSIFAVLFFALPTWRIVQAQSWHAATATILESQVGESRGDDGPTYRVEVRYRYQPATAVEAGDGPIYESDRYDFTQGMYSSGHGAKAAIVAALPPGTTTPCWYDPEDPAQAVIERGMTSNVWLGAVTLIFPLIGFTLAYVGLRQRRRGGIPDTRPTTATMPAIGQRVLQPGPGRRNQALAMLGFCAFWNGLTWTFIAIAVLPGLRSGDIDWAPTIFLGIFALIGAGLAVAAVHRLLALGNPRLVLELDRADPRPGDRLAITWDCQGDPHRLLRLRIDLEGSEEATYRRGTKTHTDKRVFATRSILDTDDHRAMQHGRANLDLPADLVPSLAASNNKLVWRLCVRGEILRWPDVDDAFDLSILPPSVTTTGELHTLPADDGPALELDGDRTTYAPGETITGRLRWNQDTPPRQIELRLFWRTMGKGTEDLGLATILAVEAPASRGTARFRLTAPAHPPSCDGQLVSVAWALELVADRSALARRDLVLAPGGSPLRIG